jgi:hypothetical protein
MATTGAAPLALVTSSKTTWTATAVEITAWNPMAILASDTLTVNKLGLFGADLEKFKESCAGTATTPACVPATYENHNGWGVGISFTATTADRAMPSHGAGFETSKQFIALTWAASAAPTVNSGVSTVAIAAATPLAASITVDTTADGFGGWIIVSAGADKKAAAFAARFFKEEDTAFFFEAAATTPVWSISGVAATPANVANAAFVLVSATFLTAAATSVIAASLLF